MKEPLFKTDHDLIKKINSVQNSWTAKLYPEYDGMTVEQMIRRAGGKKSRVAMYVLLYYCIVKLLENYSDSLH